MSAKDAFATIFIDDKIENIFVDKKKIKNNLLELLQYHKVIIDKASLKTTSDKIQPYEYKVTILSESNGLFLIVFNHLAAKNDLLKIEIEDIFSAELHALLPYLNKTGKELVDRKTEAKRLSSVFELSAVRANAFDLSDNELKNQIKETFPSYSKSEIMIAYYLIVGASIKQIASITHKNENAIRVMIHRLLSKSNFRNRADFVEHFGNNMK